MPVIQPSASNPTLEKPFNLPANSAINFFNALPKQTENVFDAVSEGLETAEVSQARKSQIANQQNQIVARNQKMKVDAVKDGLAIRESQSKVAKLEQQDAVRSALDQAETSGDYGRVEDILLKYGGVLDNAEFENRKDNAYGRNPSNTALLSRANKISLSNKMQALGETEAAMSRVASTFGANRGFSRDYQVLDLEVKSDNTAEYKILDKGKIEKIPSTGLPKETIRYLDQAVKLSREKGDVKLRIADANKVQDLRKTLASKQADWEGSGVDDKFMIQLEMDKVNKEIQKIEEKQVSVKVKAKMAAEKMLKGEFPELEQNPIAGEDVDVPGVNQKISAPVAKALGRDIVGVYTSPSAITAYKIAVTKNPRLTFEKWVLIRNGQQEARIKNSKK